MKKRSRVGSLRVGDRRPFPSRGQEALSESGTRGPFRVRDKRPFPSRGQEALSESGISESGTGGPFRVGDRRRGRQSYSPRQFGPCLCSP